MAVCLPENFNLSLIRSRLGHHEARLLPIGTPLDPEIHHGAAGATLDRRAAVACILRDAAHGPEVLLIKRAEHPRDPWSGHMAFPGGREEPSDPELRDTALRETYEEIGLDLGAMGAPLGRLDDMPAIARGRPTGLLIAPFVYELQGDPALSPNHEVQEVIWGPLAPMIAGDLDASREWELDGVSYTLPAFDVRGRIVWGLTFQMLNRLFSALDAAR